MRELRFPGGHADWRNNMLCILTLTQRYRAWKQRLLSFCPPCGFICTVTLTANSMTLCRLPQFKVELVAKNCIRAKLFGYCQRCGQFAQSLPEPIYRCFKRFSLFCEPLWIWATLTATHPLKPLSSLFIEMFGLTDEFKMLGYIWPTQITVVAQFVPSDTPFPLTNAIY